MKTLLRMLARLLFRFRSFNERALSAPGPALLISNHVSWIDWLFLGVCLEDDWRFVTSLEMVQRGKRWMRPIIDNHRTFPVDNLSPFAVKRMAEYLRAGGRLVLFAEGRLSRTGSLMKLFDGTGFLLHKTGAKVIVACLRGAHRLPFSPNPDRKRWFPKVTAHFSDLLTPPRVEHLSAARSRIALTNWLRDQLVAQQFATEMAFGATTVPTEVLATARQLPNQVALEDANGKLAYRRLMAGADLLARQWRARWPGPAGAPNRIGVLLPNVNGMPLTLLSLWFAGQVPAVLNYSIGVTSMLACAQLAGLKRIITSKTFLARAKLPPEPFLAAGLELIYLEGSASASAAARSGPLCSVGSAAGRRPPPTRLPRPPPSFFSPAVPKARPRASNSPTPTSWPTSARSWP